MGKVLAGITISVDGFITGPGDGPGCGLGVGGERLHHWVFGGPWSYDPDRQIGAAGSRASKTVGRTQIILFLRREVARCE
jgi:hypothetical protein